MSWDIDTEGPTDLNPPTAMYLVEITEGTDKKKNEGGQEVPRTRQSDGCPMMMFKAKIVMDANGGETFHNYSFNIMVANDDRGNRIMRKMIRAFLGQSSGKLSVTPDIFNGKMAWVEAGYRAGWMNCEHDSWQAKDAFKVAAGARSTDPLSPDSKPEDDDLPF